MAATPVSSLVTVLPGRRRARSAPLAADMPAALPGSDAGWRTLWQALRDHVQAQARELNAEVRRYPGPIARCDDQLPKLLEQRSQAYAMLRALDEAAPDGEPSAAALRERLIPGGPAIDDTEAALRAALLEALDAERRAQYARRD